MQFGFSYVGLIFLVMLMVPNLIWTKHEYKYRMDKPSLTR